MAARTTPPNPTPKTEAIPETCPSGEEPPEANPPPHPNRNATPETRPSSEEPPEANDPLPDAGGLAYSTIWVASGQKFVCAGWGRFGLWWSAEDSDGTAPRHAR